MCACGCVTDANGAYVSSFLRLFVPLFELCFSFFPPLPRCVGCINIGITPPPSPPCEVCPPCEVLSSGGTRLPIPDGCTIAQQKLGESGVRLFVLCETAGCLDKVLVRAAPCRSSRADLRTARNRRFQAGVAPRSPPAALRG